MMSEQRYNKLNQEIARLDEECRELYNQKIKLEQEYTLILNGYTGNVVGNIEEYKVKLQKAINKCVKQYDKKMNKIYTKKMQISIGIGWG